jgi:hypothetical protein
VDWVGAVTAGAAGIAAVLAGVNLYVSGRRELDKWTRETLIETLAAFLDGSFNHSNACSAIFVFSSENQERNQLRSVIITAHDAEIEALTRLRILAPPALVEAALVLLEAEYSLAEHCFGDVIQSDAYHVLSDSTKQCRTRFIETARSALGLRNISGAGSFDIGPGPSWTTLRGIVKEAEKAGWSTPLAEGQKN